MVRSIGTAVRLETPFNNKFCDIKFHDNRFYHITFHDNKFNDSKCYNISF